MKWGRPDADGLPGVFKLELPELIRANALMQRGIDFDGYTQWYTTLSADERAALACKLFALGSQYLEPDTWSKAMSLTGAPQSLEERVRFFDLSSEPICNVFR